MNDSFAQQAPQRPSPCDRLAAGDAKGRQRDVERKPRGATGPAPPAAARPADDGLREGAG